MVLSTNVSRTLPLVPEDGLRRESWCTACRAPTTLFLHVTGYVCNVLSLVFFLYYKQYTVFYPLVTFWLLNGFFCAWAALQEPGERLLGRYPPCIRYPLLLLVYGLLQAVQVRHIMMSFRKRSYGDHDTNDREDHDVEARTQSVPVDDMDSAPHFHSKTLDGIIEGVPFAFVNFTAFLLLDGSENTCPYFMSDEVDLMSLKWVLLAAAWFSVFSVALGVLEVDFRVSSDLREKLDRSTLQFLLHFVYRVAEILWNLNFSIFFLLIFGSQRLVDDKYQFALVCLPFLLVWLCYILAFVISHPTGTPKESLLAHGAVALAVFVTNPARFVDRPGYTTAARKFTFVLILVRLIEVLVVGAVAKRYWYEHYDCISTQEPGRVGPHILQYQKLVLIQLSGALLVMCILLGTSCGVSPWCASFDDDAVLEMIPDPSNQTAQVVRAVPRGLSSYLLQVGAGLTNRLFTQDEHRLSDFTVERVLGHGSYGVVVVVRQQYNAGRLLARDEQNIYAMKLQHTASLSRSKTMQATGLMVKRETDILRKLSHPFIVRLVYYFQVPDRQWKDAQSGETIKDEMGHDRFHEAIVMEEYPEGDLEHHILANALPVSPTRPIQDGLTWFANARRMAAEMAVAMAFLHKQHITHRDLKPSNILLKRWSDDKLHVVVTDFGGSKQIDEDDDKSFLCSLAGTHMYAAPEVLQILETGTKIRYTPLVDLYSYGKVLLVMLWRNKYGGTQDLSMPGFANYKRDDRVPPLAQLFIHRLTDQDPRLRGTVEGLHTDAFFGAMNHCEQQLPAINWATLTSGAS